MYMYKCNPPIGLNWTSIENTRAMPCRINDFSLSFNAIYDLLLLTYEPTLKDTQDMK